MAEWLVHSNQKLYQARLLLENQEQVEESASDPVLAIALQESVLFQLVLTYQSYLHEVAEIAQYRDSFSSLQHLMELVPVATGEMTELRQLELDDFSWLRQLQSAFEYCSKKDNRPVPQPQTLSMIKLHDQTAQSLPLRDWYQSMYDMIDMQRNNRQEC
ncbi:MAG: hypothetical protein ACI9MS_003771 [Glaciecola sp.]|jgi:hypothetical protein